MDDQKIKLFLKANGFSEWESVSYWILVKYGQKTAVELSRLSRIPRSKTYEIISKLRKRGLVMKVPPMPTKGVTQKFVALEPSKVFESKIHDLKDLSNSLQKMYKNQIEPKFPNINMYTSKEAVKELFHNLQKDTKLYIYLSDLNLSSILGYSFEHFLNAVKKKSSFILRNTEELRNFAKNIKNYTLLKTEENMSYIITSNKVVLDLYKSQHVILEIVSKEAVNTFIELFKKQKKT